MTPTVTRTVVVKWGGAANEGGAVDGLVHDVGALAAMGTDVVVVHGGGAEVTRTMRAMGVEPVFVDGHRVTDADAVDVVRMVLVGRVNKDLVSRFNGGGRPAVGLCGQDGRLVTARPRRDAAGRHLGFVGDVDRVDPTVLRAVAAAGMVPVVAPVAGGPGGRPWNVNADAVAGALAAALGASALVLMTDVAGLYEDPADPATLVARLGVDEVDDRLAAGRVAGGMAPKLAAAATAVRAGVGRARIVDGRRRSALLPAVLGAGPGTTVDRGAA